MPSCRDNLGFLSRGKGVDLLHLSLSMRCSCWGGTGTLSHPELGRLPHLTASSLPACALPAWALCGCVPQSPHLQKGDW